MAEINNNSWKKRFDEMITWDYPISNYEKDIKTFIQSELQNQAKEIAKKLELAWLEGDSPENAFERLNKLMDELKQKYLKEDN